MPKTNYASQFAALTFFRSRVLKVIIIRAGPFADLSQAHVVQSFILFFFLFLHMLIKYNFIYKPEMNLPSKAEIIGKGIFF